MDTGNTNTHKYVYVCVYLCVSIWYLMTAFSLFWLVYNFSLHNLSSLFLTVTMFFIVIFRCEFIGANLSGAVLDRANLQSANLQGCWLIIIVMNGSFYLSLSSVWLLANLNFRADKILQRYSSFKFYILLVMSWYRNFLTKFYRIIYLNFTIYRIL